MGAVVSAAADINERSVINYHDKISHKPGVIKGKPPLDTRKS